MAGGGARRRRSGDVSPRISNRRDALNKVAAHVAGNLQASSLEEATGLLVDDPDYSPHTSAEIERLEWAKEEVVRRLYKIIREPPTPTR